jgi:hypothetical protein
VKHGVLGVVGIVGLGAVVWKSVSLEEQAARRNRLTDRTLVRWNIYPYMGSVRAPPSEGRPGRRVVTFLKGVSEVETLCLNEESLRRNRCVDVDCHPAL